MKNLVLGYCELCGAPLDADNFYGSDDFPLCRFHFDKTVELMALMLRKAGKKPQSEQPTLFDQMEVQG